MVGGALISPYQPLIEKTIISSPKPMPPSDWKDVIIPSSGLSLKLPPDWVIDQESIGVKSTTGKDSIAISTNSKILIPTTYNQDLFKKIYGLKVGKEFTEKYFDDEIKFKNIDSGKILTGQPYTVFTWEYHATQTGNSSSDIKGFILKDTTLIIFTLNKPKAEGIEILKKIVSFASLI